MVRKQDLPGGCTTAAVFDAEYRPGGGSTLEEPPNQDELQRELEVVSALDIEVLTEGLTGYGEYDTIIRASDENGLEHDYLAHMAANGEEGTT